MPITIWDFTNLYRREAGYPPIPLGHLARGGDDTMKKTKQDKNDDRRLDHLSDEFVKKGLDSWMFIETGKDGKKIMRIDAEKLNDELVKELRKNGLL